MSLYRQALKLDPRSFDGLWRMARAHARLADHDQARQHKGGIHGKRGYDYAFMAIGVRPRRVEGHYWAAICVGEYGRDMGMLTALRKGMASKFLRYVKAAVRLDPAYDDGGPYRVLGTYHHMLPWPLKSNRKALKLLRRSLVHGPGYGITHALLAEVLLDEGRRSEARTQLRRCLAAPASGNHPQIVRRYQRWCSKQLARVLASR